MTKSGFTGIIPDCVTQLESGSPVMGALRRFKSGIQTSWQMSGRHFSLWQQIASSDLLKAGIAKDVVSPH
ncbi:hypothetical protein [Planctopirus hydrillae]|uniref:hypothetical protein n=1 Tax=Planctopirus hydrillae TaxID=1841610 RepID=UPI0010421485|nr:hypothetical protein [Planctopirus hydrillae]